MSLQPGDIITTGTPPGVGMGMKPPIFLKPGDKINLSIEKLGEQKSEVKKFNNLCTHGADLEIEAENKLFLLI